LGIAEIVINNMNNYEFSLPLLCTKEVVYVELLFSKPITGVGKPWGYGFLSGSIRQMKHD